MAMTEEQQRKYIEGGGAFCPYCGSKDISASPDSFDFKGNQVWGGVECDRCGKTWKDIYTLTHIQAA